MGVTIYLLRHGQTDWNAKGRLQGQVDIEMNDFGRAQVAANARKLKARLENAGSFDFVSSPIGRTTQTMEILRKGLDLPITDYGTDERLKELDYGEFSGHTWAELRRTRPLDVAARFDNPWTCVVPRGECYGALAARVLDWYESVERDTIVTTHAGISRILQAHLMGTPGREVAFLEAPQDRILVLHGKQMSWL
jgi:probable phosphoglycerate mutase